MASGTALALRYREDPALARLYKRKLLQRGWAGKTDPTEKAYILAHAGWAQTAARVGTQNLRRTA